MGASGTPCSSTEDVTNAVVASCVVLVPLGAVGAVGMPLNAGDTLLFCTNAVVAI